MNIVFKNNVNERFDGKQKVDLEIGCGMKKQKESSIGTDMLDSACVDIVGDIYEVLASLPNSTVDTVYAYHFIEHVPDVPKLLSELSRIIKLGGHLILVAPHFSNPYFYSDPTHRTFFGLYTFAYYANNSPFKRKVPMYGYKSEFDILSVDLSFKSSRPFFLRHIIKYTIGAVFNSSNYFKEFYEENLCYIFPCYEVKYTLQRNVKTL